MSVYLGPTSVVRAPCRSSPSPAPAPVSPSRTRFTRLSPTALRAGQVDAVLQAPRPRPVLPDRLDRRRGVRAADRQRRQLRRRSNRRFDQVVDQLAVDASLAARMSLLGEAEAILWNEMPTIPLFEPAPHDRALEGHARRRAQSDEVRFGMEHGQVDTSQVISQMDAPEATNPELASALERAGDAVSRLTRWCDDFPTPGVPVRGSHAGVRGRAGYRSVIEGLAAAGVGADLVAGVDARGFLLGGGVAMELGCGVLAVRKAGKLPPPVHAESTRSSTAPRHWRFRVTRPTCRGAGCS